MTTDTAQKETLGFQTEVKQILRLMITSLYSNKEIFLRELISNASDACDKLRFEALADEKLYEGSSDFKISVSFDEKAGTITISDNGVGMNRDEVISNIGTIAKSGTKEFLEALSGDKQKDANMIGQFGVGFYSSFIVADKVTLKTRRAGTDKSAAVMWESAGDGEYTIEGMTKNDRGTEITLHLKEGEKEFLDEYKLKQVLRKFSDHITLPIFMQVKDDKGKEKEDKINEASAIWLRSKSDIKKEEYDEFYKTVSHDFGNPLTCIHNKLEGNLEYTLLLYIPERAPFDLWAQEHRQGIKLYVKRVFIMDDAEKFLPRYLRFIRGIVDSNDLPLNISREILQDNQIITTIKNTAVKKILDKLEDMAKNEPENFKTFWKEFGRVFKEGVVEDFANKDRIASISRFSSTFKDKEEADVTLDDYIFRQKKDQKHIYYIVADSFMAAKNSPLLEVFRKKEIEVLLLSDKVDHWFVNHLLEYKKKTFQSVSKGELDIETSESNEKEDSKEKKQTPEDKQFDSLVSKIKKALGETVQDVRVSQRLVSSPACVVSGKDDLDPNLKRLMEQMGQVMPTTKPILEINPHHAILKRLDKERDDKSFNDWSSVLYDQAVLSDGGQLKDPAGFVSKLNALIVEMGKAG
ncbi:MAG: molecular chaperone HtpG [Deltaproteobacteria bacterium]|nr:molecular chaperone HtpG [Deltaproteobacteria bacterium]